MKAPEPIAESIELKSSDQSSATFCITIESFQIDGSEFIINVTKANGKGENKSFSYPFSDRAHGTYLNFYEALSVNFGSRMPQNRIKTEVNTRHYNYQEVLSRNIHPNVLYGYGDPAVIRVEEETGPAYYCVVTSNDAPNAFPILRSTDLLHWEFQSFVFPERNHPVWAASGEFASDYWAPEMHLIGNEFCIYFVARDKNSAELCIGLAKSSTPTGPFISANSPLIKGNVIDPHVYVDEGQQAFLYWKEDNNEEWPALLLNLLQEHPHWISSLFQTTEDQITAELVLTIWPWLRDLQPMERFQGIQILIEAIISDFPAFTRRLQALRALNSADDTCRIAQVLTKMKTPVFAQALSKDGASLSGERTKVLENDLEWEAHLVEGMWVWKHEDLYFLFYAGNDFSTDQYGIGAAVGRSPLGPFTKQQKPFLQSSEQWLAPGHPSVVTGLDGRPLMFLHAYFPGSAGYKQFRALLSIPLQFKGTEVVPG